MSLDRLLYPTAKIQKLFDRRVIFNAIFAKAKQRNGDPRKRAAITFISFSHLIAVVGRTSNTMLIKRGESVCPCSRF